MGKNYKGLNVMVLGVEDITNIPDYLFSGLNVGQCVLEEAGGGL